MKDPVALSAVAEAQAAVEMLRLHIAAWEHRLLATERNLYHAVRCRGCERCRLLFKDLLKRRGNL